jgi:hypothetical protein
MNSYKPAWKRYENFPFQKKCAAALARDLKIKRNDPMYEVCIKSVEDIFNKGVQQGMFLAKVPNRCFYNA